ncbi:GNAT family N-acetyltransferase [Terricaulis sp.]|uniref:GNAT family N-acetyltransferase n=1 Tax=Terricaulis sp. TaxID=2768686 RepID=UPI003783EEB5
MLLELKRETPEFETFVAALRAAGLPTEDLHSEPFRYFSWNGVGFGGVGSGADALLRSIVVPAPARGRGAGVALTEALARCAAEQGTQRLWLLTTGAAPFFEKLGWRPAARPEAPASIAGSQQFSGLCPASAALMVRPL